MILLGRKIEPHMSSLPSEPQILWRFVNGRQDAYCVLQTHPTAGLELRYIYNGVQLIGVVSPDADELQQRAQQWRLRLVAEGWTEADRRSKPSPFKAPRAGVKG
jgi:hypothetical protein